MMDPLVERVKNIISEHLGVDKEQLTDDTSLVKDLGADSLDAAALLLAINETFNIRISPEMLDQVYTVSQLVDLVRTQLLAKQQSSSK